jgi:hypothetical protein
VLHHIQRLEPLCAAMVELLGDDGLLYFDEFVGPTRFQWTDEQLAVINRLLARLSPELVTDLVSADGSERRIVRRPDVAAFIEADPSEAIRSAELVDVMATYFEPLELRAYGGTIYHQLFNRVMGNFAGQDDLVRTIVELDFILVDAGVLESDHLWAVYRPRTAAPGA